MKLRDHKKFTAPPAPPPEPEEAQVEPVAEPTPWFKLDHVVIYVLTITEEVVIPNRRIFGMKKGKLQNLNKPLCIYEPRNVEFFVEHLGFGMGSVEDIKKNFKEICTFLGNLFRRKRVGEIPDCHCPISLIDPQHSKKIKDLAKSHVDHWKKTITYNKRVTNQLVHPPQRKVRKYVKKAKTIAKPSLSRRGRGSKSSLIEAREEVTQMMELENLKHKKKLATSLNVTTTIQEPPKQKTMNASAPLKPPRHAPKSSRNSGIKKIIVNSSATDSSSNCTDLHGLDSSLTNVVHAASISLTTSLPDKHEFLINETSLKQLEDDFFNQMSLDNGTEEDKLTKDSILSLHGTSSPMSTQSQGLNTDIQPKIMKPKSPLRLESAESSSDETPESHCTQ